jgi:DNA replication initiation complex subunit (GINS family)
MKINDLKKRLQKERPMREVVLNIPEDVYEDLSKIAAKLDFSNSEALMRAYIGQGLRVDLERFESKEISNLVESLRRHGIKDEIIASALSDLKKVA